MTLNPPRRIRAAIYVATAIGTPIVGYLKFKGYIGDAELALWGGEVTVFATIAGLNLSAPPPSE